MKQITFIMLMLFCSFAVIAEAEDKTGVTKAGNGEQVKADEDSGAENFSDPGKSGDGFRRIEAMFGILPNNEGKINQLAFIQYNYTPFINSSIKYYDQKYAKIDREENEDEEIEEIESLERTDVNFTLVETRHNLVENGKTLLLDISPGIYVDYYHETKTWELNESWENDAGLRDLSFAKYRVYSRSIMPIIKADFIVKLTEYIDITLGGGYLFYSFDNNEYHEFCTTTDPDPDEQIESYYDADIDVEYNSSGYAFNAKLALKELFVGTFEFDFYYLIKSGTSSNVEKYWDTVGQEYIFDEYDADDERTLLRFDAYWYLDFFKLNGITPVLKFGYVKQKVVLDDEYTDENLSYDKYDLGIAFKF